ncbi:hypothetical protein GCM10023320_83810 [Pseudonocardia adelaidensis]|uniref:Uncharacterized protein n=1 Tax=Pseudonocardia adelaidensis TaxID=648754 RepID=A0ABP9PCT1_9PSEU
MPIAPSGYSAARHRPPSARAQRVLAEIRRVYHHRDLVGREAGKAGTAQVHAYARDAAHAPYVDELADLGVAVRVHLGTDPLRPSVDEVLAGVHRPGTHLYTCGPPSMMDDVLRATRDWPEGSVHHESFTASAAPAGAVLGEAFPVRLALSGKELVVGAWQTLLQCLLDDGSPSTTAARAGPAARPCLM